MIDTAEEGIKLIQGDSLEVMKTIEPKSVSMIFADPPYFLSSGGTTCINGKRASVDKGEWDTTKGVYEKHTFNREWLSLCKSVLMDNGTIWVSGTFHNIYSVGHALDELDFKILNNITWRKSNPPPNLGCRVFTHSTETILWAKKNVKNNKHVYNYKLMKEMNNGKQMKDVWETSTIRKKEKIHGNHPTQKPISILRKIILASTNEGDTVLDPFLGSGTTALACKELGRKCIGIEIDENYLAIARKRLSHYTPLTEQSTNKNSIVAFL